MYINYFALTLGLYFLIICFCIKKKHILSFVLSGEYLIKAKSIKDRSRLESDISVIQLIFGITLILGAIIEPNILIEIFIWLIVGFYVFKLFDIRKKVLNGYYN